MLGSWAGVFMPKGPIIIWPIAGAIVVMMTTIAKVPVREMSVSKKGMSFFRSPPKGKGYRTVANPAMHCFAKSAEVTILAGALEILRPMRIEWITPVRHCSISIHDIVTMTRPIRLIGTTKVEVNSTFVISRDPYFVSVLERHPCFIGECAILVIAFLALGAHLIEPLFELCRSLIKRVLQSFEIGFSVLMLRLCVFI